MRYSVETLPPATIEQVVAYTQPAMIATHELTKWFGQHLAVNSIDLTVEEGDVVGFLGPNGAGKSTTLRMISGYLPPSSGTAEVAGFDIKRQPFKVRQHIGYLPESTPLYPEMRVTDYLKFRARLFRIPVAKRSKAIKHVIERCWLKDVRRKSIGQLSKGFRQRVGLAATMLHDPKVLLLDEPTSGLDPTQIREVRGLIRELAGDHTIFLSTHILPEVEMTCDKVIIIARGQVRAAGELEALREGADDHEHCYRAEINTTKTGVGVHKLSGVRDVRSQPLRDGWCEVMIYPKPGAPDLRESIAKAFMIESIVVRELQYEKLSLEELFVRLTSDEPGDALVGGDHSAATEKGFGIFGSKLSETAPGKRADAVRNSDSNAGGES